MKDMRQFDAKGMKCPLPVLKARRLLKEMAPGEQIEIEATDPGAPKDFVAFLRNHRPQAGREAPSATASYVIRIEAVG